MSRYVVCKHPRATVGRGKHCWWDLEQARARAREMLWGLPSAKLHIGVVADDATGIATGLPGPDAEERWRVLWETPVEYIETVGHSEEKLVELTEQRMTNRHLEFTPIEPGTQIEFLHKTPPLPLHYIPHLVIKVP